MAGFTVVTKNAEETQALAARLAKILKPNAVLCLFGDLGTGKTTFVKGIAEGLKIKKDDVHSPTFVLMNIYEGKLPLFHFDLYRLDNAHEIEVIGYEEFLYGDGVSVIEWAEKMGDLLPKERLDIRLDHLKEGRRIRIDSGVQRYQRTLRKLES